MNDRLAMLLAEASKNKIESELEGAEEEETMPAPEGTAAHNDEMPDASSTASSTMMPPPLVVPAETIAENMTMLERMLRVGLDKGQEEDEIEPFDILEEDSRASSERPGFYSRLLQDEEPIDYIDEEEDEEYEEDEMDEEESEAEGGSAWQ